MPDRVTFSRKDQSRETTRTSFHLINVTDLNFSTVVTAAAALESALDGISLADTEFRSITIQERTLNPTQAGNKELKWLVRVQDTVTGEMYSYEVGCADESMGVINVGGKTIMDPASAEYGVLALAISDANIRSKAGNTFNLIECEIVGRAG